MSSSVPDEIDRTLQQPKLPAETALSSDMIARPIMQSNKDDEKSDDDYSPITDPGPHDVLMGRGAPSTDAPGNLKFRELVKLRRNEYVNAKRRKEKQQIAGEIIATVKSRGGRFLERVETYRQTTSSGDSKKVTVWQPLNHHKTLLVKVKQLMRDVGPDAQEKRNLRHEQRRQNELEALKKSAASEPDGTSKGTAERSLSSSSKRSPVDSPRVPRPSLTQSSSFPLGAASLASGSLAGMFPQQASLSAAAISGGGAGINDPLVRLRLEQEAVLRRHAEESILMQQLQQQQQSAGLVGPLVHLPMHPQAQSPTFSAYRDSILQQALRLAQEDVLLQQHLQQQGFFQQHQQLQQLAAGPTAAGSNQTHMLSSPQQTPQQQQTQALSEGSLLAAIMRRNAAPSRLHGHSSEKKKQE